MDRLFPFAFALASGGSGLWRTVRRVLSDYRRLSRYAWYIYGAVFVLGAICVYQTTFMGPGAPRMLGITVGDTSEYAALLYPAAYALAVYALRGKKGGFWLSLAALAPFALLFLWDRYVGILPQLLFAVCAAAVLLSAIRAGLFQVKRIARGRSCGRCWCLQLWGFSIRTHSGIRIFPTGISVPPVCGSGGRFCGNIGKIPPRLPLC